MKILLLLFSIFFSIDSYAQSMIDTVSTRFKKVVFVVDGLVVSKEQATIVDVFSKIVVPNSDYGKKVFVDSPVDTVYVINTKQDAILKYQKKLSKFSIKYQNYLNAHQGNDEGIIYWIFKGDSEPLALAPRDLDLKNRIKTLYDIPESKIKKVDFSEKNSIDSHTIWVNINLKN